IREFLPRDYGDILFRGPMPLSSSPQMSPSANTAPWNLPLCPKCGLKTQGRKNVEKHTLHCQRKPSIFNCEICGLECHDLTTFKSHLCSHFKQELMNVIGSDVSRCDDCGIDFGTDSMGLATHVKSLMMETIYCFICQKEFGSPSDVSGHECIPVEEEEEPEEEGSDEFCRLCGEVAITSYQQYKEHLYSHLLSKLNNDFRSDYDKDKKACERCEEPVEDCVSYIKHLALDHDEYS
ncbi:Uncharacterized protein FKW44_011274, partial [Caligus rogercresseyi]